MGESLKQMLEGPEAVRKLEQAIRERDERIARLTAAIRTYGQHLNEGVDCYPCTCGFDALLAETDGGTG